MLIKPLESRNVSVSQKILILDLIRKVCADSQKLVDIYINYDCDPAALDSNIFEKIVNMLSRTVQTKIDPALNSYNLEIIMKTKV